MTVTTLEPATIEHLDFEPDRSCETRICKAGNPTATHIAIWHMPCGCYRPKLICSDCAARLQRERQRNGQQSWHCKFCRARVYAWLRDLVECRPLP